MNLEDLCDCGHTYGMHYSTYGGDTGCSDGSFEQCGCQGWEVPKPRAPSEHKLDCTCITCATCRIWDDEIVRTLDLPAIEKLFGNQVDLHGRPG